MTRLGRDFYQQPTLQMARDLLGKRLVRALNGQRLAVMGAVLAEGELGDQPAEGEAAEVLKNSPSGQKLRSLGYGEDVAFCAQIDVLEVVPIYRVDGFVV